MLRLLLHWVLSAVALILVSNLIRGFRINGFGAALIAAIVIGLVNVLIGIPLKLITLPLSILTLGIFYLFLNAVLLKIAAAFVPNFEIDGLMPAFWGSIVLSLINMLFRWIAP